MYRFLLPTEVASRAVTQWLLKKHGNCTRGYSFQDLLVHFAISICSLHLWNCFSYTSLSDNWLLISTQSPIRSTIERLSIGSEKGLVQPDGTINSEMYLHSYKFRHKHILQERSLFFPPFLYLAFLFCFGFLNKESYLKF